MTENAAADTLHEVSTAVFFLIRKPFLPEAAVLRHGLFCEKERLTLSFQGQLVYNRDT